VIPEDHEIPEDPRKPPKPRKRVSEGHTEELCGIAPEVSREGSKSLSADRAVFSGAPESLALLQWGVEVLGMDLRRTLTAKDALEKRWHDDSDDPPCAVRAWSATIGNVEHELDPGKTTFTCGAHSDCDVQIDDPQVSAHHALFERRGGPGRGESLRVIDTDSKNGIRLRGERRASFEVTAGQSFELARSVTVFPLSAAMRVARLRLFEVYGRGDPTLPLDQLLVESSGSSNLLLLGESGCGHQALAHTVHAVSRRRTVPPEVAEELPTEPADQRELIRRAARSTLILPLKADMASLRESDFLEEIMSADHQIRLIACSPTERLAVKMLGTEIVGRMRHVLLRPLRTRLDELPQVFDQLLAAHASTLRTHHLSTQHQAALKEHAWPSNFDELDQIARYVAAIAPTPTQLRSVVQVATALGVGKTRVYDQLQSVGLSRFWEALQVETPPAMKSSSPSG
jgi:hypothetical protein